MLAQAANKHHTFLRKTFTDIFTPTDNIPLAVIRLSTIPNLILWVSYSHASTFDSQFREQRSKGENPNTYYIQNILKDFRNAELVCIKI